MSREAGSSNVPSLVFIGPVVFSSGAIVMALELAGSRLLAPYFGSSLFIWTSLIGVVLAFMSLGYYLGGRIADRHVEAGYLFWILVGAAISTALIAFSEAALLPVLAQGSSVRLFAVLSSTVLFAVPATLLGMISPYCVRLRMHSVEDSGATVGTLYALGTLGSIAGTFAAGFWLISYLGTRDLIILLAAALGLLSLVVIGRAFSIRRYAVLAVLAVVVLLAFSAGGIQTVDTRYDRYLLQTGADPESGRPLVALSRDERSAESISYADTGEPYRFSYYDYYDLAPFLGAPIDHVLLIGGGTFSYPRLFIAANPDSVIDTVEIDDDLYPIAVAEFGFSDDPRIPLFFEDGRVFLNKAEGPYGAVFMDAFNSEATVPYQLATQETWQRCFDVLAEDGVLVMNVIASPGDDRSRFFDALFATIDSVFADVRAFAVEAPQEGALNNTVIIAAKNPDLDILEHLRMRAPEFAGRAYSGYAPRDGTRLFTDDYAPVDQYLLGF